MPAELAVVLLAVTELVVAAAALGGVALGLRTRKRRDLDSYLEWLLQHAAGPVGASATR